MTVKEYILPYYLDEPITKKIYEAVDIELEYLRYFLRDIYPCYLYTDYAKAWHLQKQGTPLPYEPELHHDLERKCGCPIRLITTKDNDGNDIPDIPRLLYAACLLLNLESTPTSEDQVREFIHNFVWSIGYDPSKWSVNTKDIEKNKYFEIRVAYGKSKFDVDGITIIPDETEYVNDPNGLIAAADPTIINTSQTLMYTETNIKMYMESISNVLSSVLPAHIVQKIIKKLNLWDTIRDYGQTWDQLKTDTTDSQHPKPRRWIDLQFI
jgi:hypothetical protein